MVEIAEKKQMISVTATIHYHLTAQHSMLLACTCHCRQHLQLFHW